MNYSSKNTISQQKADGPSDFLGITQSSGLDRSDSARYKALGNSVAIPCVEFIISRIAAMLRAA